jgi:hypothetical protein
MAYQARCPECQAKLNLDEAPAADELIECPKCGNQFAPAAAAKAAKKAAVGAGVGKADGRPEKKKKDKKGKAGKGGKGEGGVKRRKMKQKKSNRTILILMVLGGLTILGAVGGIGYYVLGRAGKVEEMLSHVPGDFNVIRGMNVGLISRYPGYLPQLDPQYNNAVKNVADDLATAVGEADGMALVDYAVHAKRKQGGTTGEVFVIRTKTTFDPTLLANKYGAAQNADGQTYHKAPAGSALRGAIVYSPNNRMIVVVSAVGQQDGIFRTSAGGMKQKENSFAGKMNATIKKVTAAHIWTLVYASGDHQNYLSAMADLVKPDFPVLGNQMAKSKVYGVYLTFGTKVKCGVAFECESKDAAKEVATSLSEGPLGKGDDSEIPNKSKSLVSFSGSKEFKSEYLANIKYSYTGECAYAESTPYFPKSGQIITAFNNPFMGDGGTGFRQ